MLFVQSVEGVGNVNRRDIGAFLVEGPERKTQQSDDAFMPSMNKSQPFEFLEHALPPSKPTAAITDGTLMILTFQNL